MEDFYSSLDGVDEALIRQEKDKARKLRKTTWWQRKTGQGRCHYCGHEFKPAELTMDHIVPLTRGGRSVKGNLTPACKDCNSKKKAMLPMEWDEYVNHLTRK